MLKSIGAAAMAGLALASAAPAQTAADDRAQVEDIVVTGRRSGVPMWTVRSDSTTIVLVGAIAGVSKTTKWDPAALTEALRKADRVMFPQSHALTVSNPFNLIGWLAKYKKMGSLPKDQNLGQFLAPEHMKRLTALQARGMAQSGFERRHPFHLSNDLRERAKGDVDYGRHAADYVERAIKTHKLKLAVDPIAKSKAKPVVKDLFASLPAEHVPCLIDSIAAAEAGPSAVQARSDAWAARRVPEVLASPADKVYSSCWPAGAGIGPPPEELLAEMRALLDEDQVTVAVLGLRSLAEKGGILDRLEAEGFDIQGPVWK
ncbi:MAG TPA: TraB/GumN family protein [Allosphingosinicella sp.]|nr:TraB/GumN family protein [Allosphingosinicella sp.]